VRHLRFSRNIPDVTAGDDGDRAARLSAWVEGRVQGVGFRYWVVHKAAELGLAGSATNLDDGRVEIVAEGSESACQLLIDALESGAGPGRVTRLTRRWDTPRGDQYGFVAR
jgi:acylphosphatase